MADPYVLDMPTVVGDLNQTLVNLIKLRAEISAAPKPSYSIHGHAMSWVEFNKYLGTEIDQTTRQISRMQPFEFVSMGR